MNVFAKFDEIPLMVLQDIKETKRNGHTQGRKDRQRENTIPTHKHSGIWPKFELIQAVMHVLVTSMNEEDSIKKEGARAVTTFLPL